MRIYSMTRRIVAVLSSATLGVALLVVPAPAAATPADPEHLLLVGGTGSGNLAVLGERNGRLSRIGANVPIEVGTLGVAVPPNGRFAYVAHTISGSVQGFRVARSGRLDRLPAARLSPGQPVTGVVPSVDGRYLFVTVGSVTSDIETYRIADSGALAKVGAVRLPGAISALSIPTVSPDGKFLFAPSFVNATMQSYRIGADGRLTAIGRPVPTGERPALPSVTPDGRFLYITNEGTNDISGYRIAPDGALTPIGRFPTKMIPHGMAITRDGRHLYVPQTGGMGVSGFRIAGNGALVPLPAADAPSEPGHFPGRVVLSPDGERLYVIDTLTVAGTARVFTLGVRGDGSLQRTGAPAVDTGVFFSDGATGVFATPQP